MEGIGNNYGIKVIGSIVSVEKLDTIDAKKVADYDFIISDSFNGCVWGCHLFDASISNIDGSSEWKINDKWTLKQIHVSPSDWHRECLTVTLQDSFGQEIRFGNVYGLYKEDAASLLRDVIKKAIEFARNNLCVSTYKLKSGISMDIKKEKAFKDKISKLKDFSENLKSYIEEMEAFAEHFENQKEIIEEINSQLKVHLELN